MAIVVRARDLASRTVGRVRKELNTLGKVGGTALRGLTTAMAGLAAVSAVGLVGGITAGVRSLGHLERVGNATNAVLETTRGVSGQTAESIRKHAEALEQLTTADDKAIQEGQNLLLTFTKIGGKTFPRATKAAVNLAIAMAKGDVANADFKGSALQVGKALNDPVRGITALRRAGVSFTKDQEKQIKSLVKAGKVTQAQTIILKELETEFGNAGKAAGTGFEADMRRVQDAGESVTQALARGVMPALSRFAGFLSTKLADPKVQRAIANIGDDLGKASSKAVAFIEKIDWNAVGSGLASAKDAAASVVGMFNGLPPWAKTAIVTGWGLNKLSGGAVSGIVSELGKGLIKGVLGMTAGVVNIKAGVVTAAGGGLPGGAGKGGIPGPVSTIAKGVGGVGLVAGSGIVLAGIAPVAAAEITNALIRASGQDPARLEFEGRVQTAVARGLNAETVPVLNRIHGDGVRADRRLADGQTAIIRNGFDVTKNIRAAALSEQRTGERIGSRVFAAAGIAAKGGYAAAAAIKAKKLAITVRNVNHLRLTVRDTQQKLTFQQNAAIYG